MVKSKSLTEFELKIQKLNNTACIINNFIGIISIVFGIIIAAVILSSLDKLEHSNCKCAELPERRFLKEWYIIMIVYFITLLILFGFSNEACWNNFSKNPFIYGFMIIVALINIVMLIRLFIYIRLLRNNCSCGYGNKEAFIFWYLIIVFSIWAFLIVLIFILVFISIGLTLYRFGKNRY